ncbi:VanZ like protein [Mariniflexile fucanivorans]|uniref:VanZ like protein n=1 Tax=Mariniflexile fucanivorans TaxID=264023 RepID=A0A4R1RRI4_9FLAO|nr:VanZ family protein [Mariniflexile fucanivorans]TCL69048.1 VanZ like protein [Mariniflexile fucanivorans]
MLKKLIILISVLFTVALAAVCLIKINNIPDVGVSFGDKIFHFLSYTVLAFLWYSTFYKAFNFEKKKALMYTAVFSIIFGIIIEILQGTLTSSRSADLYDVMANTIGVFLAVVIISIKNLITIKK